MVIKVGLVCVANLILMDLFRAFSVPTGYGPNLGVLLPTAGTEWEPVSRAVLQKYKILQVVIYLIYIYSKETRGNLLIAKTELLVKLFHLVLNLYLILCHMHGCMVLINFLYLSFFLFIFWNCRLCGNLLTVNFENWKYSRSPNTKRFLHNPCIS